MVFKKRISCIVLSVLFIFAVCAPCALGVFAAYSEGTVRNYYYGPRQTDVLSGWTGYSGPVNYRGSDAVKMPYPDTEHVSLYTLYCLPLAGSPSNVLFNWSFSMQLYNARSSYNVDPNIADILQNSCSPCYALSTTSGSPTILSSLLVPFSSSFSYDSSTHTLSGSVYIFADFSDIDISSQYFESFAIGFRTNWFYHTAYSSNTYEKNMYARTSTVSVDITVDADPPAPDPEPADDGWTYGTTDLYFTNISDSNFAFNQTNYPFSSFPSKDIIVDDSPSKIITGAFWDNTDWLSSGTTISGQLQVQFTSPLTSVDNFIQRGFIWFVNGSDPSLSGFQYYEVPTSWEYMFTVWKYGINQWTNEYIFNFEFTLPEDLQTTIGFTPVNILIGLYGILPSGSFSTECWYNVQNLVFGYYIPPSEGEPEVPSTPVFNNPDNTSTVINPSEPTVVDNLNQELGFYDNVWKSYNLTSDTFIDFFEEVIGFGATNLDDALGRLYQAFSYTGSGSINLPSATIPWGDTTLQLWEEQEIPLAYWFSNLPSPIKIVFGFIIVFSVASACWGISFFFIRKIVSGNYQANDF